jgi:hypothetical protein
MAVLIERFIDSFIDSFTDPLCLIIVLCHESVPDGNPSMCTDLPSYNVVVPFVMRLFDESLSLSFDCALNSMSSIVGTLATDPHCNVA